MRNTIGQSTGDTSKWDAARIIKDELCATSRETEAKLWAIEDKYEDDNMPKEIKALQITLENELEVLKPQIAAAKLAEAAAKADYYK